MLQARESALDEIRRENADLEHQLSANEEVERPLSGVTTAPDGSTKNATA